MNSSIEMFDPEVLLEAFGKIAPNIRRPASFSFPPIQVDLQGFGFGFDDPNESEHSSPGSHEENIIQRTHGCVGNSIFKKTYSICRGESSLLRIPLPQSAALFYNGYAPLLEIEESCESIKMLDSYLKERKEDVTEGALRWFLHVVLRQDVCCKSSTLKFIKTISILCALLWYLLYVLVHFHSPLKLSTVIRVQEVCWIAWTEVEHMPLNSTLGPSCLKNWPEILLNLLVFYLPFYQITCSIIYFESLEIEVSE